MSIGESLFTTALFKELKDRVQYQSVVFFIEIEGKEQKIYIADIEYNKESETITIVEKRENEKVVRRELFLRNSKHQEVLINLMASLFSRT